MCKKKYSGVIVDKIYSRKRIKLPKAVGYYSSNRKSKGISKVIIILIIAILTSYSIIESIKPIFEGLALQRAKAISTDIMNRKTSEVLSGYNYKDLVWIMEDEEGKNSILRTDVVTINKIASEIAIEVESNLASIQDEKVGIPLGGITGSQYLAGIGPEIPIEILPAGNVTTELKTEFEAKGINQTIYRIYLELDCDIKILTPYNNISHRLENQVLLVETVIVGEIPNTYYNLEGIKEDDTMEVIGD